MIMITDIDRVLPDASRLRLRGTREKKTEFI